MSDIPPVVRQMILCEDVRPDPVTPHKLNLFGLVNTIQSFESPAFPLRLQELCILLQLTSGRGTGRANIAAVYADTDQRIFQSPAHSLTFASDPLSVAGVIFRVQDCVFPWAGLYWIQFRYNGKLLASQPLMVKGD